MIKLGSNSIGQIYLGSNSIGKAYLGSNLVFQKGSSPTPGDVIPYIRGGADGSYIDTGITPDNTTQVIVWARNFNPGTAVVWLFGSRVAYEDSAFTVSAQSGTLSGVVRVGFGNASFDALDMFSLLSHYHKYEFDGSAFSVDDSVVTTITSSTFSNQYNIHLFGINNGGTHAKAQLPIDICAVQIYKNGQLVRDYTPVDTPSVGLYDAVSDTVFTNAGSGSFTYGTFNTNAYTPLEYIATSGASAFITPAIGSYSLPIVTKFRPTSTSADYFTPVSGRDETERCEIFTGNTTYSNARLYAVLGSDGTQTIYNSTVAGAVRNKDLVVVKNNNTFTAYYNNAAFGSAVTFNVSGTYSTGARIGIGAQFLDYSNNPHWSSYFVGNIYYVGLGEYNLVPAKVSGAAGMYDTYNDTFYPSTTSTPFSAGPEL